MRLVWFTHDSIAKLEYEPDDIKNAIKGVMESGKSFTEAWDMVFTEIKSHTYKV